MWSFQVRYSTRLVNMGVVGEWVTLLTFNPLFFVQIEPFVLSLDTSSRSKQKWLRSCGFCINMRAWGIHVPPHIHQSISFKFIFKYKTIPVMMINGIYSEETNTFGGNILRHIIQQSMRYIIVWSGGVCMVMCYSLYGTSILFSQCGAQYPLYFTCLCGC